MVNNIFQGLGQPQTSPMSVPSPFFAPPEMGIRTYDYDLEKAKQLLLAMGFSTTLLTTYSMLRATGCASR
jgi:peptide/nickel transport system substrate-binding protein